MSRLRRIRVALGIEVRDFLELLARSNGIYNGFSDHPEVFATPNPSLPTLKGKIEAFDVAQQAVSSGLKSAVPARDLKAGELVTCLETGRAYVQELCDENPERAEGIIKAATMRVVQVGVFKKPFLQAKQRQPGEVVQIIAHVAMLTEETKGKVFFSWQYSADGGATWITTPATTRGRTEIGGLTPLHTYSFRVRTTDARGAGEWSQVLTFLVL